MKKSDFVSTESSKATKYASAGIYLIIIAAVIALDQVSKYIAARYLATTSTFPIIKDVIHLTYVENTGAAFGMLKDRRWVFMVVSSIVIVVILVGLFKYAKKLHPLAATGLSFAVGGGVGNMIDRVANGFVVDFIDFTLIDFAVFNVADSFICVGVGLLILDIILGKSDFSFLDGKNKKTGTEDEADSHKL